VSKLTLIVENFIDSNTNNLLKSAAVYCGIYLEVAFKDICKR
jgi:hypothetical protein